MDFAEFQHTRNKQAEELKQLPPSERYEAAVNLANEFVEIACDHGFITQTHYWVFQKAGLFTEPQGQLELF